MKKVKIIFSRQYNENITTDLRPYCLLEDFKENINKTDIYCASWDDNRLVEGKIFEIRELVLPDWMDEETYLKEYIRCNSIIIQAEEIENMNQKWFHRIVELNESIREIIFTLLRTKKFRSAFRESLKNQLVEWLNNDNPEYSLPFSDKQLNCLIYKNRY